MLRQLTSLWKLVSRRSRWGVMTIMGVSLSVTTLAIGAKQIGWLEMAELAAYDGGVRWRKALPPDPRLLIVAIGETDIQRLGTWPLSDRTIALAIAKLTAANASVIGLDIFRPTSVAPGQQQLAKIWQDNDRIIPGCYHGNLKNPGIAGPPGMTSPQLGFVDLVVDRDSVVRRALLFVSPDPQSPCATETAFSLQLAQEYLLRQQQIEGKFDSKRQFQLGTTHFHRISSNDGGYHNADAAGYQILLNYRSPRDLAPIVSIGDILANKVDRQLINNRVVLIGSIASSIKDDFLTPYSQGKAEDAAMPGVIVHAQITSQILSAVLDRQQLWWTMPKWLEGVWLGGWCLTGSMLAWYVRHPFRLLVVTGGAGLLLVCGFAIAIVNTAWLPLVSPLVGLVASSIGVLGLTSYRTQQQHQQMASLVGDRDRAIAELKLLLEQTTPTQSQPAILPETTIAPLSHRTADPTVNQDQAPNQIIGTLPPDYLLDGRYQAQHLLGAGGFGVTYRARDTKRPGQPQCVIKQLVPARRDPNFVNLARRLFQTEAEILAKLGHHAQIPHLLAYFEERQEFYLVQEFIDGTTLDRELAAASAPWRQERVIDLLQQLLPVLGFIHSQYVIHRDIKPSNIIRSDRGKLVLIDFGAVKEIQPHPTPDLTIAIGTRGYAPPEQYAGRPNYTSDLYALGSIAIEALTNTHPRDLPVDDSTGNLIWQDRATVTPALARVLDRMVAYFARDRYQSATAVLMDLDF